MKDVCLQLRGSSFTSPGALVVLAVVTHPDSFLVLRQGTWESHLQGKKDLVWLLMTGCLAPLLWV